MSLRRGGVLASRVQDLMRVAGVSKVGAVLDARTVVGPVSYLANGFAVDLSAAFSEIYSIKILRAYITATKLADGRLFLPAETGTDVFISAKFRIQAFNPTRIITPAGTVAAPVFAGGIPATHTHTYNESANSTDNGSVSALDTIGGSNPHTHTISKINVVTGATAGPTPTGTNTAPAFTGAAIAAASGTEVLDVTNLSTITVEYLVFGKPL